MADRKPSDSFAVPVREIGTGGVEPKWCEAWTSHDDVGGEGEHTFYHECGQVEGHDGKHSCFGHTDEWGEWDTCNLEWPHPARTALRSN